MKKATTKLIDPTTKHSIEDRRALTDDALKLSKHELQKVFKERIATIATEYNAAVKAAEPMFASYNMLIAESIVPHVQAVTSDLRYSINLANSLPDWFNNDDENENEVLDDPSVQIVSTGLLLPVPKNLKEFDERFAEMFTTGGWHTRKALEAVLRELSEEIADTECFDYQIPVKLVIELGNVELVKRMDVDCGGAVADARENVAAFYEELTAIQARYDAAKADLDNLPDMIKELDMAATAMRVSDAGGEQFLGHVMRGVERILAGETNLSGLALVAEAESQD